MRDRVYCLCLVLSLCTSLLRRENVEPSCQANTAQQERDQEICRVHGICNSFLPQKLYCPSWWWRKHHRLYWETRASTDGTEQCQKDVEVDGSAREVDHEIFDTMYSCAQPSTLSPIAVIRNRGE